MKFIKGKLKKKYKLYACSKGRVKETIPRCLEYSATQRHHHLSPCLWHLLPILDPTPYELYHLCSKRTKNWHLHCSGISREPGLREPDDKPSVLIIYDVIASLSFRTVQDLYGNTVTSLVWGQWCLLFYKACAPHRWPLSGSSFASATLMEGIYKPHLPPLTQYWLWSLLECVYVLCLKYKTI